VGRFAPWTGNPAVCIAQSLKEVMSTERDEGLAADDYTANVEELSHG
jgi:hypothetical protein